MKKITTIAFAAIIVSLPAFAAVDLAKVGSRSITDQDVKDVLAGLPEGQRQQLNSEPEARLRVIDNIVVEEVFVQEAEKSGVANDPEFKKAIERARRQLLSQRFLQSSIQPKITDAAVEKFFNANKTRYSQDEVRASHVLVKTEAEAQEIFKKAKGGEDFEVLAKKHSKDPSAAQNMGDLGYFTRARMVPEFANAAFSLKKGEISNPVKSAFGWHVIKLVDTRAGKPVKFADVKDQVKGDFQNESINELIKSLKEKSKAVVFEDKVKALRF